MLNRHTHYLRYALIALLVLLGLWALSLNLGLEACHDSHSAEPAEKDEQGHENKIPYKTEPCVQEQCPQCPTCPVPPKPCPTCPVPEPCPTCPVPSEPLPFENQLWDGKTVVPGPLPWMEACRYRTVNFNKYNLVFNMCIRAYNDIVSTVIYERGRWQDCDPLIDMWHTVKAAPEVVQHDPEGIFVDAGANIGSCSLLMAAAGHKVYGFEPSRANFFYLSSGALANNLEVRNRMTLYQMGLGTSSSIVEAHVAQGNAGNTVLETEVKDWADQSFNVEDQIAVGALDDVLWPDHSLPPPHIRLMKMDVQGYELKILKGCKRLLAAGAIGMIKSEVTEMFLAGQGTSSRELLEFMSEHGFDLVDGDYKSIPLDYYNNKEIVGLRRPLGFMKAGGVRK